MSLSTSGRTWEDAASPAAVSLARRFEDAWREGCPVGRRPNLQQYLVEIGDNAGARLALLRADMGLRYESGEAISPNWYRRHVPDLSEETLVALIYEDFCLREEADEAPDSAEYLARYPEVAPALRRVLDIHGLVGSGDTSATGPGGLSQGVPFPEAGETIAGFQLVEELGRGAFARVFLALERQLANRPVALKVARVGTREPQNPCEASAYAYCAGLFVSDRPGDGVALIVYALLRSGDAREGAGRSEGSGSTVGGGASGGGGSARVVGNADGPISGSGRAREADVCASDRLVGRADGRGARTCSRSRGAPSRREAFECAGER